MATFAKENWIFFLEEVPPELTFCHPKSPNELNTDKFVVKKYLILKKTGSFISCSLSYIELLLRGWLLASATYIKGLHFCLFTFTSAIALLGFSLSAYTSNKAELDYSFTLLLYLFIIFFQSRECICVFLLSLDTCKLSSLIAAFWMLWSSTDTCVVLRKARGLSAEVLFWVRRQTAQVSLRLALKIAGALHTSDVISP